MKVMWLIQTLQIPPCNVIVVLYLIKFTIPCNEQLHSLLLAIK